MKYVSVLLFLSICLVGNAIAQQNDFVSGVDYLSQSVATVDRTNSGIVNPAALGFWTSMGLQYAHSFTDSTYKGDDGLLLASKGAFFSIEWLHHSTNISRRKYTLATGDRIFPNFYAGISYSWFGGPNSIYKNRKDWKMGLLYHPKPFASLGLVVDRINQPTFAGFKQKRLYQPGIGLRPFGEKLTFSADGLFLEGKALSHGHGIFRIVAGPFRGISLTTDYRNPREWRFGFTYDIQQTRLGGQARLVRDTHYAGGTYFIEAGAEEYSSEIASAPKTGSMILKGDIVEEPRSKPLFGQSKRSFYSVIRDLRRGATDPKIGSLLVKIEDVNLDFASAQELRNALSLYRANGKKVITFMGEAGNLEYYLASVSDEIYMDPSGLLELKGLAATAEFYKGTLDKLGIKAEILATGPHKTYGDAFVDTTLTDAAREQIDWLLDDLYGQFVEGISTGRGMTVEQVRASIDAGPYTSRGALKAGLIDGLKHYDELTENDAPFANQLNLSHLYEIPDYNPRWSEPSRIALVYADGSIMQGENGSSLLQGKVIGSKTLSRTIRQVKDDPSIEGVVFRINSPGGDVFASDEIYRQLVLLKEKKPLVVSMGGVAASGGYYIACPGDEIIASPGTITGSIGVVMGKVDLSGLYEKIGYRTETIKRGRHADIRSSSRSATDEEMALIDSMIWEYYGDFVTKVSTWRKIDFDSVDAIGEGRVWTGRQAKENGLVDSYGGLFDAIEKVRQKAKIDPRNKIEIATYPVYGVSVLPALSTPSLESQISSIFGKADEDKYYYKSPFELKIK